MASVSVEVELTSSLSASKLFKLLNDPNILPIAAPQMYKSLTIIQGDGDAGSLRSITFSDGSTWKQKVTLDLNNLMASYTVFESDSSDVIIDTATHHHKLTSSTDGGSVYKHTSTVEFKGDTKVPDDFINTLKESIKNTFKAVESYAINHPEAY